MYSVVIDDVEYEMKSIPYAEMLEAVREMVGDILVCDEDSGKAYERYDKDARMLYYLLKYFTDYEITGNETRDEILALHDRVKYNSDKTIWDDIDIEWYFPSCAIRAYNRLLDAVRLKFVAKYDIGNKLVKTFGSVLGDEDVAKTLAEGRTLSENLLDLMQKAKLFDENKRDVALQDDIGKKKYLKTFAKKEVN